MNHILSDIDQNIGEMKMVTKEFEAQEPLSTEDMKRIEEQMKEFEVKNESHLSLKSF